MIVEYFKYYTEVLEYLDEAKKVYKVINCGVKNDISLIVVKKNGNKSLEYKVVISPYGLHKNKRKQNFL